MYRLHGFSLSGNTFKVAFFLNALRQPWEAVHVDYLAGQTREPGWREAANVMGEAPVLETPDGRRLSQSGAILTWLARRHAPAYLGADEDAQHEVLRWLLFDNHKFTSYFATYRFMKSWAPTAPDPAVMAFLKGRMDGAFGVADKHLAARAFLVGDAPTIADFSLSGYLFFPVEESGYPLEGAYPNLAAWRDRMKALPGWADPYDVLPGERPPLKW